MMKFQIVVDLALEDSTQVATSTPLVEVTLEARSPRAAVQKLLRAGPSTGYEFEALGPRLLEMEPGQGLVIRVRRLA
jgi:hypothetical protein